MILVVDGGSGGGPCSSGRSKKGTVLRKFAALTGSATNPYVEGPSGVLDTQKYAAQCVPPVHSSTDRCCSRTAH